MNLNRANVTVASRIMFPTYVVLFTFLGINYTFNSRQRLLESPALRYADDQVALPVWGGLFFACAALMAAAMVLPGRWTRMAFAYALWLGLLSLTAWSGIFFAASVWGEASPTTWCWPAFAAVACYASHRSLLAREV